MACPTDLITTDKSIPSGLGLYANGLPGVTLSLFDDLTKDEQEDYLEFWDDIYQRSWDNFASDVQTLLADKFHIDLKLVSRETSKFLSTVNDATDSAGVTIEFTRPKYGRLHVNTVDVFLEKSQMSVTRKAIGIGGGFDFVNISFANGYYFGSDLTAGGAVIIRSTDGLTWETVATFPGATDIPSKIVYGNGIFLGTSIEGSFTSEDGETWTFTAVTGLDATSLIFGNDIFVCRNAATTVKYSEDGLTWTSVTTPSQTWNKTIFADGKFVAINTTTVYSSLDLQLWEEVDLSSQALGSLSRIAHNNGIFVIVDQGGGIHRSPDAVAWSFDSAYEGVVWANVVAGNGVFLAVASSTVDEAYNLISTDGKDWAEVVGYIKSSAANSISFGNNVFVASEHSSDGEIASVINLIDEISDFGTIIIYEDDEDGDLLGTYTFDTTTRGKITVPIHADFDADKIFVSITPNGYFRKSENRYFTTDHPGSDKLSCSFPCGYGEGAVTQVNGGGVSVTFNVYCSIEKVVCDNINLFKRAFWYRIGVELMIERRLSDRFNRWTTLTTERAEELMTIYQGEYDKHLKNSVKSLSMREDPICFQCGSIVDASTVLP